MISGIPSFISGLDSSTSVLPIVLKDNIDILGRTTMAYTQTDPKTRVHEARERFIEETGTGILWIGAIPALRWLFDKTCFNFFNPDKKKFNFDPKLSLKKIANSHEEQGIKDIVKHCLKPNQTIKPDENKKDLDKTLKKAFKKAHITKTALSTLIPLGLILMVLPWTNQRLTKKLFTEEKDLNDKNGPNSESINNNQELGNSTKNSSNTLFKGWHDAFNPTRIAQGAQVNPVGNMLILDYTISSFRVWWGRTTQEKIEVGVKEAGIIFFFYVGADLIKKGLQKACRKLGKPIRLDYITLQSKEFQDNTKKAIKNKKAREDFLKIATDNKANSLEEKKTLDFIDKAIQEDYRDGRFHKYTTLQAAKETGLIGDFKGILIKRKKNPEVEKLFEDIKNKKKSIRDGNKYIKISKVKELQSQMEEFLLNTERKAVNYKLSLSAAIDKEMKSIKNVKLAMILLNIAICNAALGYVLPKLQYIMREKIWGSKTFPGIKNY